MKPLLEARDITVSRGTHQVLSIKSLTVDKGEALVVIGPNGAGKSTLLLTLAQLIRPSLGSLYFNGHRQSWNKTLAYRRQIGLVLQEPLMLNTSVANNVSAGLRFRKVGRQEINRRVSHWLERFGVLHLLNRPARQLSGGEAQRVSLARAFALKPAILLLDEPFSALDRPSRTRLLADFQALITETHQTTIFVTHDMDEAWLIGHQIAVLLNGEIRQRGAPDMIFAHPKDPDVAAFVGLESTILGKVVESNNGWARILVGGKSIEALGDVKHGQDVFLYLRPEDVTLWAGDALPQSSARNQVTGQITSLVPRGPLVHVVVDCGFLIGALITRASLRDMDLTEGQSITATFKASAVHLIPL